MLDEITNSWRGSWVHLTLSHSPNHCRIAVNVFNLKVISSCNATGFVFNYLSSYICCMGHGFLTNLVTMAAGAQGHEAMFPPRIHSLILSGVPSVSAPVFVYCSYTHLIIRDPTPITNCRIKASKCLKFPKRYKTCPTGGIDMPAQHGGQKPSLEAMKQLLVERVLVAERLIKEDMGNGVFMAEDAESFDRLHEVTDPNCYVSEEGEPASTMEKILLLEYEVEDWINYWQTLIEALDSWLRNGMEGSAVEQLQDDILIARF